MLPLLAFLALAALAVADTEVTSKCPPGTTHSPNRNKCLNAIPVPLDFKSAVLSCGIFNSRLAKIDSAEEHEMLIAHLNERSISGDLWLGGTNVNTTWSWHDGKNFTYSNWKVQEPSNPERENCLQIEGKSGFWSSGACEKKVAYVCEMEPIVEIVVCCEQPTCPPCPECATTTPESCPEITECPTCPTDEPTTTTGAPTTTLVPHSNPVCPFKSDRAPISTSARPWLNYGANKYAYFAGWKNFFDAEATCASFGAHLASLHDKGESDFVAKMIPAAISESGRRYLWIGALTSGNKNFCWTDGSSWNYDAIRTPGHTKNCVLFFYADPQKRSEYEWRVGTCDYEAGFVCKKSIV